MLNGVVTRESQTVLTIQFSHVNVAEQLQISLLKHQVKIRNQGKDVPYGFGRDILAILST